MIIIFLHLADIFLWLVFSISVVYIAFFAIANLIPSSKYALSAVNSIPNSDLLFIIIIPAYHEDNVIRTTVNSLLHQNYPRSSFSLCVVADGMRHETVRWLQANTDNVVTPDFGGQSSKARSLQAAAHAVRNSFDHRAPRGLSSAYIVILDADNVVDATFLSSLNKLLLMTGNRFIQCHRKAKNTEGTVSLLDAVSEEINNTVFRRAHNRIGLSSALIGSGMCFPLQWFISHVDNLSTAGEDREFEEMLMLERHYIYYAENIIVEDEKVSTADNFSRQRQRWVNAQWQCLIRMVSRLRQPAAHSLGYVDKTIQQALLPRSFMLIALPVISLILAFLMPAWAAKWAALFILLCLSLLIAVPRAMFTRRLAAAVIALPRLALRMTATLLRIDRKDTRFYHTAHYK